MLNLDTKHKKKSFAITLVLHILIVLLLFYLGFSAIDPEPEGGIAINFGTTETGSGIEQPTEAIQSSPTKATSTPAPAEASPEIIDEVSTQDLEDAPVIEKKPKKKLQQKTEQKTEKAVQAIENPVPPKEIKKPDPKPDQSTLDILNSFSKGPKSDGTAKGGEGNDATAGDKGSPDGDPNARSYYGTGKGLDGDGNYRLGGRKALNKEKFVQDCNESGIVVVRIEVNQNGKVIKATPGVKGTTNSESCLLIPAKRAALATKFNSDAKAPTKQIGTIIYQFKISQ